MEKKKKTGFTLVELSAASTLLVLSLGLAVGGYVHSVRNLHEADVQVDQDIDIQKAVEYLKKDVRLSSLEAMFYYPAGAGPYKALSLPLINADAGSSPLEKNQAGKILWDKTVIYHIRQSKPYELVRTVFQPRDNSLTEAQRQEQLEAVVKRGSGENTYNGQNASSQVIFSSKDSIDWDIKPKAGRFDAYAPVVLRDRVSLGYAHLTPGEHEISFKIVGKNEKSRGYKVGLDQLHASASASPREAEALLPAETYRGSEPIDQYMPGGSWTGNRQLAFPASSVGEEFTLVVDNDRWEETNFGGLGYEAENARIEFREDLDQPDYVVQLDGMDKTWEAGEQTGSAPSDAPPGLMKNWVVRVMQKGADLADNGNWFKYNGRRCRLQFQAAGTGKFKITNVFIGETASSEFASMDFNPQTRTKVTFSSRVASPVAKPGTSFYSDWVDFKIDKSKNYLVSYRIVNNSSYCHPAFWKDVRDSVAMTCMVVTNGSGATAKDNTWSDRSGIRPLVMPAIVGLASIEASYPEEGIYTSQIFDTYTEAPQYGNIDWNADVPEGTMLAIKTRTGNRPDLSDASDWKVIPANSYPHFISASYSRFVQFQAILKSSDDGMKTPLLEDVTIDWKGKEQYVNIGGIFTKGPDMGSFEVAVDGEPLLSALMIDLHVSTDVGAVKGRGVKMMSSLQVALAPRNSGL